MAESSSLLSIYYDQRKFYANERGDRSVSWSIVCFVEQGRHRLDFEEVGEFQPCGPCVVSLSVLAIFALVLLSHL